MNHDFSKVRFPNEEVATFDDRIDYYDVIGMIQLGFAGPFEYAVRDEWERRQGILLKRKTA